MSCHECTDWEMRYDDQHVVSYWHRPAASITTTAKGDGRLAAGALTMKLSRKGEAEAECPHLPTHKLKKQLARGLIHSTVQVGCR